MKSEQLIRDEIEMILQEMKTHQKNMTALEALQYSSRMRGLWWVLDDMAASTQVVTLDDLPKIEQVIDAVHKE